METESFVLGALILVPALLALASLVLSFVFFRKAKESSAPILMYLVGGVLLVGSLGVGTCYAAMFLG